MPARLLILAALAVMGCSPGSDEAEQAPAPVAGESIPHAPESAVASSDGVIIFYDDRGSGDSAVVLVHGWNCDRDYWQLQRDFLAETHRVVSVDLAGHGRSALNREQWSIGAFGDDVAAVVRELDLTGVTLVGHSMGGPVVLDAAGKLGDRVRQVVGVDTLNTPNVRFSDEEVDAFVANLKADYSGTVASFVDTMFVDESHQRVRDFVVRDMASSPPDVGIASLEALAAYNPVPAIKALDVPLVLINSDYRPTATDTLEEYADEFRFIEMSGVGHFVMLEDPVAFTNHLASLL